MINIKRKIVTDETMRPIAVMIDYEDWQKIEKLLQDQESESLQPSLEQYAGVLRLTEDPVAYQQ
ncbi:MAG: hypothetical protein O7F12_15695, partial [Nitrospirae bacterium]|nr:hypothetical protein [Nitrospirota bacterium]